MRAATEGSLPPVMPQGNLVEVLGREVRQGSPGQLMVESSPSRQRRPPCKTNKEMSDQAADAAALTYLLLTPSLGGAAPGPLPSPPSVAGAPLPGVRVRSGLWGSPRRGVRPAAGWGAGGGRLVSHPPRGVAGGPGGQGVVLPPSVPLPSLGGHHCRRHWGHPGHGGRGPHTALVCCRVPPPGVAFASFVRAGAGVPACRDPRGSRRWGARGHAVCGSSCVPPRA